MTQGVDRRRFASIGLLSAAALALPAIARRAGARPGLRLGLVTYNVARDWDLDSLLRICREAAIEGLELRTTHAHGVERTLSPADRATVRRKCEDAGLAQLSLGSVCEFHSPDPAVVRRNEDDCREWVLLARDVGARAVKVRPNGLPSEVPEEQTLEQIGRALARCGAFAGDHGVEIWVEVHGDGTRVPARMRRIMDACGQPSVGVTWNSNDSDVKDGSVAVSFELLRRFVRCCHVTDLRSGYPYRELFSLLAASGFEGFSLCEYPQPVPAEQGTKWLHDYRVRWEALQRFAGDAPRPAGG